MRNDTETWKENDDHQRHMEDIHMSQQAEDQYYHDQGYPGYE